MIRGRLYRHRFRVCLHRLRIRKKRWFPCWLITVVVATILTLFSMHTLERQLQPTVSRVARTQVQNAILAQVEQTMQSLLLDHAPEYGEMVKLQYGPDGSLSSLSTDPLFMNRLRSALVDGLLEDLADMNVHQISIPVGSLIPSELFWGRGPDIRINALSVGSISAEYESEFTGAGVNQTMHRILLKLEIPATVLLPLCKVELSVDTAFCIAETVIVGQVPNAYLLNPG